MIGIGNLENPPRWTAWSFCVMVRQGNEGGMPPSFRPECAAECTSGGWPSAAILATGRPRELACRGRRTRLDIHILIFNYDESAQAYALLSGVDRDIRGKSKL